jgi:hypothetical protein
MAGRQHRAVSAERRYAACDPDNRLIAAQLEKNWEMALRRVCDLEARRPGKQETDVEVDPSGFTNLADNLAAAWNAPGVTMRARQQLLRTLITDIIVNVDDDVREVVLAIHWRGGQHSELRVRKPRTGEHGCATAEDALAVMRSMAGRWSDEHIAASLNRMGLPTRPRQNLDGAPRLLGPARSRNPRLQVSGKRWRVANHVGSGEGARHHKPHDSAPDQRWRPCCRASCSRSTASDPRRRLGVGGGQSRDGAPAAETRDFQNIIEFVVSLRVQPSSRIVSPMAVHALFSGNVNPTSRSILVAGDPQPLQVTLSRSLLANNLRLSGTGSLRPRGPTFGFAV